MERTRKALNVQKQKEWQALLTCDLNSLLSGDEGLRMTTKYENLAKNILTMVEGEQTFVVKEKDAEMEGVQGEAVCQICEGAAGKQLS